MSQRPNLKNYKDELEPYFKIYGSMLDVGCGNLKYLFQFDNSKFTKLVGIDLKLPEDPFQEYLNFKYPKLSDFDYHALEKRFLKNYSFLEQNIVDVKIKKESYGFIFCKHVIHFIPHEKQILLTDILYNGLRNRGLLFLKINHNQNKQYSDSTKVDRLYKNCFKEKRKDIIHYLNDPDEIVKNFSEKYLPISTDKDDKSVTILIRK